MATGWEAVRIAWPAFLVPFLFAASPELLLYGSLTDDLIVIFTAVVGVFFVTAAITGFLNRNLSHIERLICVSLGIAALLPHNLFAGAIVANLAGVLAGFGFWFFNRKAVALR